MRLRREQSTYLAARRPRYELTSHTVIAAAKEEVFAFFSKPENLGVITPRRMAFRITDYPDGMRDRAVISYRVRIGPVPVRWTTRIEGWQPGERFVDTQLRGPYHCWWHEHRFRADGPARTIMEDRVLYTPPLGVLGRLAHFFFIRHQLKAIFLHRARAIALRFGSSATCEPAAATEAA
jgi:ligand-binding SRPBCC domain-containing protein